MAFNYQRIIIKIGSNVITQENGLPDLSRITHFVEQIAAIKKQGKEVILVSSGAVASGRSLITISEKSDAVAARQVLASIGQVKLINTYSHFLNSISILMLAGFGYPRRFQGQDALPQHEKLP
jgi:glutamate 5-kinase